MPTSLEGEREGPDYGSMSARGTDGHDLTMANGENRTAVPMSGELGSGEEGGDVGVRLGSTMQGAMDDAPSAVHVVGSATSQSQNLPSVMPGQLASSSQVNARAGSFDTPLTTSAAGQMEQAPPTTVEHVTQQVFMEGMNVSPPEELPGPPEARAGQQGGLWLFKLGEFVQRRVSQAGAMVSPLIEGRQRTETSQRRTLTPPGSWTAKSPRPRLFSATAEQQMAQWVRRAPLLYGASNQQPQSGSSRESLSQEQIVAEVQRQVRQQLQQQEERQQVLLSENQQLREVIG